MSSSASCDTDVEVSPKDRLESLFEELAELQGQRNAIDGRVVEIVAEIERDEMWGITGARSLSAMVAWKLGASTGNAQAIAAIAQRFDEFPQCAAQMREGRVSLDQFAVIAKKAGEGSDAHYADLVTVATVSQLHTATNLEPKPKPEAEPVAEVRPSITKTRTDEQSSSYRITLPQAEAAEFDAALASHQDALVEEWKRDHASDDETNDEWDAESPRDDELDVTPPFPTAGDAFVRLVETAWDAAAAARPHGHRTTVVVHLDVEKRIGTLHRGPLLTDAERQYLTCDTTCEVWFERDGQPIGAGRTTRQINRRLRRALEFRHPTCAVPGCGATRGLHAHHIRHWEDGGATELDNLVLLCPYHHRLHHRGGITITGPADRLTVTDSFGRQLHSGALARPPTGPPPAVEPCRGPLGERADWWWYDPYEPPPPTDN